MYAASSSLLALILSLIIALSGTGAVAPIPETATQTTIRDITVTLDDDIYHIEAQPYFTQAIGTEMAAGTFGVQLGNEALLPMQAAIDQNGIRLSVGDSGKVYTLTNETLAESMDIDPEDLQVIEDMISSIGELASYDTAEALQTNRAAYAVLKQVLTAGESTDTVQLSGEAVDLETYSGTLDAQTLAALLDALMNGENQPLANYMKQLLAVGNRVSNTEYASWSEALEAEGMDADDNFPVITLTYETAESGDDTYDCITLHADGGDETPSVDYVAVYTLEGGDYHCSIEMLTGDDEDQFSLSGTVDIENALTDAPSTEFDFTYGINSSWGYTDTDSPEDSYGYSNNMEMTLFGDARIENGLGSLNADLTVETSTERLSGADLETIDYSYDEYANFNLIVSEAAAENEGIDTTVALAVDMDGDTLGLSFIANRVDILFDADALFAGGEEVILTNDENDTGAAQMEADFMALANDASTLMTQDTGLADLISALTGSMYSDDDDYDDSDWGEGYEYLTADEVLARFAGTKYTINAPEGYEVDEDSTYITTDNSNAAIGYQSVDGSDYITLYLYYSPDDTNEYAVLNDDGTSALIDNTVVTLKGWEDGTYYGADLHKDDVDITLYFNSMTLEEVQSLLSTLHAAE